MHNKEINYLKLGNNNFKLIVNESSLLIYYLDDKITECYIECKFDEGEYAGLDVFPNLEIGDIPVSKNKIEELTGTLFEMNDVNESFERGDSFYLTESEPFINYKVDILEIDNTMAHVLINGICITDGYSKPYKTDNFIVDAIIPIEICESKKVVGTKKTITTRNSDEKYVNLFMFTLFGLIGGYYVFWSFYQFITSIITIFVLLLTVFCWYKAFKIYREIAMNKHYLKRKTLIDIISKKDYSDYDKMILLKNEIEKYKYYYDKRFMPKLIDNMQWRQVSLKEETKNHIKEGNIDFAYKNLFELIRAENPVLHGSNIHKVHLYGLSKKNHENYYKDGFICEKEKNIIMEMINEIDKATINKDSKIKDKF